MVASAVVWLAVTSAPSVTAEAPMRPVMGAVMLGVVQIDARGFDIGAIGLTMIGGLGDRRASCGAMAFCLQQRWHSESALTLALGQGGARRLVIGRLIGRGIDLIERLAGLDGRAFGEQALLDDAGDLRVDIGHGERIGAARQFGRELYRLLADDDEAHHRRRALWLWRWLQAQSAAATAAMTESWRNMNSP